jgi:hypothetical protein
MTPKEREALINVRNGLASGRYIHAPEPRYDELEEPGHDYFNMDEYGSTCGTVRCIGGWMAAELGADALVFITQGGAHGDLGPLFYPGEIDRPWGSITPDEAIAAIDNFLKHGNPYWSEVV